jgi:REP element-mobilizing transposase RayT
VEPRLYAALKRKMEALGCSEITVGGVSDHVHVVCRYPPAVSIAYLIQQIKGSSSHLLTHEAGLPDFRWQGGYGAFSVSPRDLEAVRRYVARQKQHHQEEDLWSEWESTWIED